MNQISTVRLSTVWLYVHPRTVRCVGTLSVMPALVSGLVIFHSTTTTAVEGERMCVFVWKAHLAEKETYNHSSLPSFPGPEGRDGSVSGAGEVTLGNLRFQSSEELTGGTISLCLQCMQTLVYACESWNSFCIQVRHCIQLVVKSFYDLLCLQIM